MQVDVTEVAGRFPELLKLAEQGQTVVILRNGLAVAELAAIHPNLTAQPVPTTGETWLEPLNDAEKEEWFRTVDEPPMEAPAIDLTDQPLSSPGLHGHPRHGR